MHASSIIEDLFQIRMDPYLCLENELKDNNG